MAFAGSAWRSMRVALAMLALLASVPLDDALAAADLAVIVTAHPDVDHAAIARGTIPTLDLRGATRDVADAPNRILL